MKTLKVTAGSIFFDELSKNIRKEFGHKYIVTDNARNEIIVAKDSTIACKIILTKKRLMVQGTFPTSGKMMLAMGILLVGGIIIPMAVYVIVYKRKFEAMEKEVYEKIATGFITGS